MALKKGKKQNTQAKKPAPKKPAKQSVKAKKGTVKKVASKKPVKKMSIKEKKIDRGFHQDVRRVHKYYFESPGSSGPYKDSTL